MAIETRILFSLLFDERSAAAFAVFSSQREQWNTGPCSREKKEIKERQQLVTLLGKKHLAREHRSFVLSLSLGDSLLPPCVSLAHL